MQVIAAVVGRLSLAYEESAKSSYSDGERRIAVGTPIAGRPPHRTERA